jgi:hypothetical protein
VDEFLANLTPFVPLLPIAFIKQAVYHLDTEDAVAMLREDVKHTTSRTEKRFNRLEGKVRAS